METKTLPRHPSLEQYRKQAKDLVKAYRSGDSAAFQRIQRLHPRLLNMAEADLRQAQFALSDAQLVIARQHGFASWPKFAAQIEALRLERMAELETPTAAFLVAASVPRVGSHPSGTLEAAAALLAKHSEVASSNIYTAAVLGDDAGVRRWLAADAKNAAAKGGPHAWDALCYLCFSRYLRLDSSRSEGFVRAAIALLDAGADVNTGWFELDHQPGQPNLWWESAIYGAAGLAHHPELTRLLLERGADPNDAETPYHAPESYDNRALMALVESGKLNDQSLTTMLLRKTDWHDYDGLKYLLEHGANPNSMTQWGNTALHHALRRDNDIENIDLLLDHGADPSLVSRNDGRSGTAIAARRGRGDVLASLERRGIPIALEGVDRLIAACARNDSAAAAGIAETEPALRSALLAEGDGPLVEFAGKGNTEGVRMLLDLGIDVGARYRTNDNYFDVPKESTALHSAAWRLRHETVKLLLERGAPVDAADGKGRTALMLAIRGCVDSYWTNRRTPELIEALLQAGAAVKGIEIPTGYQEADELLQKHA